MVICLERGADCLHMVQLMPQPSQNPIISCLIKSRLVLPFWHRRTQVVLERRLLNGCSSSDSSFSSSRDVKALRPNHSASTSASFFGLGLMASGLIEIGLVASNIYWAHDIN